MAAAFSPDAFPPVPDTSVSKWPQRIGIINNSSRIPSARPVGPVTPLNDPIDVGTEEVGIKVLKYNISKHGDGKRNRTTLIFDPRSKEIGWKKRWSLGFMYTTIHFSNITKFWIYNDGYLMEASKLTSRKYSVTGPRPRQTYVDNIFKFVIVDNTLNKNTFEKKLALLGKKVKKLHSNLVGLNLEDLPSWTRSSVAHPRVKFRQRTGSVVGGERITRKRRLSKRRKSILSKKNKYSRKNRITKRSKRTKRTKRSKRTKKK